MIDLLIGEAVTIIIFFVHRGNLFIQGSDSVTMCNKGVEQILMA